MKYPSYTRLYAPGNGIYITNYFDVPPMMLAAPDQLHKNQLHGWNIRQHDFGISQAAMFDCRRV